jgi:hypothetical protein
VLTVTAQLLTSARTGSMRIDFHCDEPFAVKVYTGCVNVISGESKVPLQISQDKSAKPTLRQGKHIQDYLVPPFQKWLDGIASADGRVSQVVAAASGSGYSLEAQITGPESIGGIQFEIIPTKRKPQFAPL